VIALVDQSSSPGGGADVVALIAAACDEQLRRHVAPAWGRVTSPVAALEAGAPVPAAAYPLVLFDDAEQAGELGYHAETPDGRPYGRVFVGPVIDHGGTWLEGQLSVSTVVSHECCELFCDPSVNLWADDAQGRAYAVEACDPVESDSYEVSVEGRVVAVSNFVHPAWFDVRATSRRFDHLGRLYAPFTLASRGYALVRDAGVVTPVFGTSAPPPWQCNAKSFPASRTFRRMCAGR
jgi:hypothetical protein